VLKRKREREREREKIRDKQTETQWKGRRGAELGPKVLYRIIFNGFSASCSSQFYLNPFLK